MARKMLINALHPEEARVAIVEDGRLVDLDVEIAGSEQIRGNVYKGVVVRVEPGLQAAFVDIGLKKLGFLQMGELHPENWRWREDIPEEQRHRRPRIQEVLRRGQEIIVQVEKGERDNKGSALTTYVSLPGRYMVLMPGSDSSGISRKVEAEGERKKLKEIIAEMTIPEGYGYIIRTEAMGRTREELQKDLDSLVALYQGIRTQGGAMKGAGMIYQESALIIRTIRDYFSADIDEVLVDSKDVYRDVRDCLKEIDPAFEKLVKMHQEKRPIFSRYQLEEQIDLIYEKKVPLKSGGSIFIEPTEALVSIDVNSGKSTGEKGVEDTAFKTNLEAAEEAARQLRLRDLGGLIVIDFIDMRDRKHNAEVEKTLKTALKADKARVNVSRISEFGLLEMSRQRIRQTLNQASTLECPHCDGRGKVKSVEAMALSFLRKVHAAAAKGTIAEVVGSLPLEVAYYLLNRKRHELSQIENDYDIEVTVKGKPSFLLNQMELELVKREKFPAEELPQERGVVRPTAKEEGAPSQAAEAATAEGRKKKRKGKGKAQPEAEPIAAAEAVPVALAVEPGGAERVITTDVEHEEQKKKRRRKRKRGKGGGAEGAEHAAAAQPEVAVELPAGMPAALPGVTPAEAAHPAEHPAEEERAEHAGEEHGEEGKKKRRRKRRRGKGHDHHHEAALEASMLPAAEAVQQVSVPVEGAPVEGVAPAEVEPSVAAGTAEPKKRRGRPARAGKIAVETGLAMPELETLAAAGEATPAVSEAEKAPALAQAAEAPKGKRGARGGRSKAVAGTTGTSELGEPAALTEAVDIAGFAPEGSASAPEAATTGKVGKAATTGKVGKAAKAPRAPRGAAASKKAAGEAEVAPAPSQAPEAASAAPKKRGRKPAAEATAAEPSAAEEQPAAEKQKKPRAPRKKKEEAGS